MAPGRPLLALVLTMHAVMPLPSAAQKSEDAVETGAAKAVEQRVIPQVEEAESTAPLHGERVAAGELALIDLEGVLRDFAAGEINLKSFFQHSVFAHTDSGEQSSRTYTIVCSSPLLKETEKEDARVAYDTFVDVFDDKGQRTDSLVFDRAESVYAWRPSGSHWDSLIVVREFLWGTTFCRLSPEGRLDTLLWAHYWRGDQNANNFLVWGDPRDTQRASYQIALAAAAEPEVTFLTTDGPAQLQNCALADARAVKDIDEGYFIVSFGGDVADPVQWVPELSLESVYRDTPPAVAGEVIQPPVESEHVQPSHP